MPELNEDIDYDAYKKKIKTESSKLYILDNIYLLTINLNFPYYLR